MIRIAMGSLVATPLVLLASAAAGQAASTPDSADYAVPVERLILGKIKGKDDELTFTAGEYAFFSETYVATAEDNNRDPVFLTVAARKRVTVDWRFTKAADAAPVASGRCTVYVRTQSGLWNSAENSGYGCRFDGAPAADYALEAMVPDVASNGDGPISMKRDDPDKFKKMKARMHYAGVVYDAVPTGFELSREADKRRVATGWRISRDDKTVGRIDFPDWQGLVVNYQGSYDRKSVITAPVSPGDGREAVIFFAGQLLRLPEANSPAID